MHGKGSLGDQRDGVAVRSNHSGEFRNLAAARQSEADQAGNDEQINGSEFQKRGEDASAAGDFFVGGAESTLDDVLVGAPVPQADDRGAEEHAEPREIIVEVPSFFYNIAGALRFEPGRPTALYTRGDERLPEIEH